MVWSWTRKHGLALACMLTSLACHRQEEAAGPLELRVLVAPRAVQVTVGRNADCRSIGPFRDEMGCQHVDWEPANLQACWAPTCVSELRLEQGGAVLARDSDSTGFAAWQLSSPLGAGASLVLEGCNETLRFELPAARPEGSVQISTAAGQIQVDGDASAAGVFAFAASEPSFFGSKGYAVSCHEGTPQATLPTNDQFGFYLVQAFALGKPVTQRKSFVRAELYPATHAERAVSTSVDLGLVWQATVEIAKLSPLYAPCSGYCAAWNAACAAETADATDCATTCTIAGEVFPKCTNEYQARLACLGQAPTCSPQVPSPSVSPCAAADVTWQTCAGQ